MRSISNQISTTNGIETSSKASKTPVLMKKIDSGWDESGRNIYKDKVNSLNEAPTRTINLAKEGNVTVSTIVNNNNMFWDKIDGRLAWEKQTFDIFRKYVTPETIVIDFGTWIGPTLLFHGQFSKKSYGIEADPAAYAVAEYNIRQNRHREWGPHVSVESACVSAPEHVGTMTMKSRIPGESMSGITEKLARDNRWAWEVQCYTLPSILEYWGVNLSIQPVMLKIDVESYECQLVPSFYDWLKDQPSLPTIYVSFHPQIADCTDDQWASVLEVFKLYQTVKCKADTTTMPIRSETTFEEFQEMKSSLGWKRSSEFVLSGKR